MSGLTKTEKPSVSQVQDASGVAPGAKKRLWGIFVRKERWGLSLRGWLAGFLFVFCITAVVVVWAHPFLAETDRVPTDILVVEGWIERYAMRGAVKEFHSGSYRQIYTTGGPENGSGGYINDFQTSAFLGRDSLVKVGMSESVIQPVPSHVVDRDRTYSAAVALRDWFREHHIQAPAINVLTEDAHARRTRLLFQKAFGDSAKIGIISVKNPDYNPKYWWRYSEGVREIISEGTAYIYARFIFRAPSK